MRTALPTAPVLLALSSITLSSIALSSITVAQDLTAAAREAAPQARPTPPRAVIDPAMPRLWIHDGTEPAGPRLHWMIDKPCRGSEGAASIGACNPPPPPYRPRP